MAMGSALLQSEQQCVAFPLSKLGGRANEWALTCSTSEDVAFPTWALLKQTLSRVYAPPNQEYRVRSEFLAKRQGKKELLDYVHELRTRIAGMAADPLPVLVTVTIFMEALRSKTEQGASHPALSGALVSDESTSARKQKRFWREHETEAAVVLDIGMSELVDNADVVRRESVRAAALYPQSDAGLVEDSLLRPGEDEARSGAYSTECILMVLQHPVVVTEKM
ncbi:hypothetical protein PInf_002719 [Phytophthora infestans]|nr:hypothetical protein PInf_002719 [Phytophthora infestans]